MYLNAKLNLSNYNITLLPWFKNNNITSHRKPTELVLKSHKVKIPINPMIKFANIKCSLYLFSCIMNNSGSTLLILYRHCNVNYWQQGRKQRGLNGPVTRVIYDLTHARTHTCAARAHLAYASR